MYDTLYQYVISNQLVRPTYFARPVFGPGYPVIYMSPVRYPSPYLLENLYLVKIPGVSEKKKFS